MTKRKTTRARKTSRTPNLKGGFEPELWKTLKNIKGKSKKFELGYETEKVHYTRVLNGSYTPDFVIDFPSGHRMYIEAKGYLRGHDIVKLIAVKTCYPDMDLRIVFQKDNKMPRRKTMRYSDWAENLGIPYAIGEIPLEWLEDPL